MKEVTKYSMISPKEFDCILELAPKYSECYEQFQYCGMCIEQGCLWDGVYGRCVPPDDRVARIPPSAYCYDDTNLVWQAQECDRQLLPFSEREGKRLGLMKGINKVEFKPQLQNTVLQHLYKKKFEAIDTRTMKLNTTPNNIANYQDEFGNQRRSFKYQNSNTNNNPLNQNNNVSESRSFNYQNSNANNNPLNQNNNVSESRSFNYQNSNANNNPLNQNNNVSESRSFNYHNDVIDNKSLDNQNNNANEINKSMAIINNNNVSESRYNNYYKNYNEIIRPHLNQNNIENINQNNIDYNKKINDVDIMNKHNNENINEPKFTQQSENLNVHHPTDSNTQDGNSIINNTSNLASISNINSQQINSEYHIITPKIYKNDFNYSNIQLHNDNPLENNYNLKNYNSSIINENIKKDNFNISINKKYVYKENNDKILNNDYNLNPQNIRNTIVSPKKNTKFVKNIYKENSLFKKRNLDSNINNKLNNSIIDSKLKKIKNSPQDQAIEQIKDELKDLKNQFKDVINSIKQMKTSNIDSIKNYDEYNLNTFVYLISAVVGILLLI